LAFYNFAKKLKSIGKKAPFDFILEKYKISPKLFRINPVHFCWEGNK